MIFLGRRSYMSPLPIELDFITKKEKSAPNRQTSPSIPKPRKSSVILNNLVEIAVDHVVRLVTLAVEGLLVHVLIHIRCTPAAHLHGIFLWNVQHCCCAGKDMPLRYNNDKRKKPLFSRGLSVCRHLFNSFSKLKYDEKIIE